MTFLIQFRLYLKNINHFLKKDLNIITKQIKDEYNIW